MNRRFLRATAAFVAMAAASVPGWLAAQPTRPGGRPSTGPRLQFTVTVPPTARAEPITGRVYLMISRTNEREPRFDVNQTGLPIFGVDVEGLRPGQPVTIDDTTLGYPLSSLRELPAGDYFVQAMVSVYSEFKRADGFTLWMHDDQWEGQRWEISPGNLYSAVVPIHVDPAVGGLTALATDRTIPPIEIPPDTAFVKRFRFESPSLSAFWGRPIYLGATVLLPKDYDADTMSYPVNYLQGHFSLRAPLGFAEGTDLYSQWMRDDFPRFIVVTFQHPNPYFDDSYAVNSPNVGPYGDALMQELIPEVERRFRVIREPWARILSGGSTGGWEALALQIFHPDFFGGTWAYCPDPVDFREYEGVDLYGDANAFYKEYEWRRVPTPNIIDTTGRVLLTVEQKNHFERVAGTKGRSGRQMDIWSAVFGPTGEDGYAAQPFDKATGRVNKEVVAYWRDHYDLRAHLEKHWSTLGPKLVDKLHVFTGDMDTFQLDRGVRRLDAWMRTTQNPHYAGYFMYGDLKPHCWIGPVTEAERLKEMAQFILRKKPEGVTTPWWRY
ncbi:MAG: alpha/beta hydrolase-fold protein [Vicinamibacterales bacterium]